MDYWQAAAKDYNAGMIQEILSHAELILKHAPINNAEDIAQVQSYTKLKRGLENILKMQGN